jgi:hypothetical protein
VDIVSHGLWGAITFGRSTRWRFWLAFMIGMAPDVLSFGILTVAAMLGVAEHQDFNHGTPPPESSIPSVGPSSVQHHAQLGRVSLPVYCGVGPGETAGLGTLGVGLHVLMDIPSHPFAFFPTPFLWPISDWKFNGWQWITPYVLIRNVLLLILVYGWYFGRQARRNRGQVSSNVRKSTDYQQ